MELKQHLIHRRYKKAEAKNQITIGEDYSVPDGKPDIASILQKKAELQMEEVHTEKGRVKIRGNLKVWVLYLAERSSETVGCLAMEFPFDEVLYMEGAVSGDNLKIDWNIEDLRVNIVHPGKLSVRALVNLWGNLMGSESHQVTENIEEQPEVYVKTDTFSMAEPVIDRKDSYRIRDEVILPANKPNVQSVLWKDQQLRGLDIRMQEGKLAIKGEVLLFVVYQGEEDPTQVQWMEQTIPFHGTLDVAEMTPEMFGVLETEISHQDVELKPDYDGEMRMFQMELILDIHMHVFEERTCNVLKDAYSTRERMNLQSENIQYEKLRMCNQTKCRVAATEKLNSDVKILQILGHQAMLLGGTDQMTEQGILREGMLEVQILYVTSSDRQPFGSVTVSVPYSQLIEIPEMQKDDSWKITEILEQIFITMPDGDQLEIRGVISFHTCVMQQCHLKNITGVAVEAYDLEEYKKKPGMLIHFVQPQETLWSIAKSNGSTMDEIKKLNDLTVDEVTPGQKLLLLKRVSDGYLLS